MLEAVHGSLAFADVLLPAWAADLKSDGVIFSPFCELEKVLLTRVAQPGSSKQGSSVTDCFRS